MPLGARAQKIWKILVFMDGQGITLANLLDGISWGDEECTQNAKIRVDRTQLLNSAELPGILRRWWKPPRSRSGKKKRPKGARAVMQNFAFDCSQQILEEEMEQLVKAFKSPAGDDVKEEHLTGISFPQMVARVKKIAPNLWVVLSRLARSQSQQERSPMKNPTNTILVVIAMFSYSRSHHRNRLQKLFAIYFKFRGLSAKGFDTLHAIGLTMSNKWTGNAVGRISTQSMAAVKRLMDHFPWLMSYDNVLIAFRVFSQRRSAKPLPSTIHKALQEMRQEGMAHPLNAFEIFEIFEIADKRRHPHTIYLILRYLLESPDFDFPTYDQRDHQLLQPPAAVRQLPFGKEHIVLQYLLGSVKIPEASYEDNANLIRKWLRQLALDSPEHQKKLSYEELTVDRLRNLFRFRAEDDNGFERLDWLVMQHLGTSKGRGLSAAFDILGQGPFFHDLSETLHIIAEAQIRELWLEAVTDDIKSQSIMFLRDVIPFILLRSAVRNGDIGIMEDMIPLLLYRFVGGRNSNYAIEMLELLQGLHREWPIEICDFIRENCWVINNTGRHAEHMPIDEAQEMNIKDIKVTYRPEGPNIDWEYIKKLHPAIHVIRAVNAHMETEFKTRVRGSKHTIPKKELDVQELQKWYRASNVHVLKPGRAVKKDAKKKSPCFKLEQR
ncbi:hypothetical protein B0H13DRAFT_2237511 [Mycena leptocephala]|nr:hypothetical protein B0H13DRAFT_2237511 [Mycena leptocephala]